MWVVNFKKSIASQLQLDVTGVRPDGPVANWETAPKEGESTTYTVFEASYSNRTLHGIILTLCYF